MIGHDIGGPFDGSLAEAVARIQARVQVIVSPVDHVLTPGPAREIAEMLGVELIELASDCGHNGMACDAMQAGMSILRFLQEAP